MPIPISQLLPRRVFRRSLRTRLTLWNVFVLALIIVCLALVLRLVVARSFLDSVDDELQRRGRRSQNAVAMFVALAKKSKAESSPAPQTTPTPAPSPSVSQQSGEEKWPFPEDASGDTGAPSKWQVRLVEKSFDGTGKRIFGPQDDPPLDKEAFRRASRGEELFSTTRIAGESVRVFSAPLSKEFSPKPYPVVQTGFSLVDVERAERHLDRALLLLTPIGLLAVGGGGLYLTRRLLRPVREATKEAARIGATNLSRRLPVEGDDEFSDLTATLNGMLTRLEASFEQQKRFTADASHELRTPLTVVLSASSRLLSRDDVPQDQRRAIERIERSAKNMSAVIETLLLLARSDSGQLDLQLRSIPLHSFIDDVIEGLSVEGGAKIHNDVPVGIAVRGDALHLSRLFTNLMENAMRHTPPDGVIALDARYEGKVVVVTVADTGEGIPAEHLPHIMERFYRVDAARTRSRGKTGLGLSLCQNVAEAHGGAVQITSEFGQGTVVSVTLPGSVTETLMA